MIVIIGILSSFIYFTINNSVNDAQDAKILKNLDSLNRSLITYYNLSGTASYPTGTTCLENDLTNDFLELALGTTTFPEHPNYDGSSSNCYYYESEDGTTYTITATKMSGEDTFVVTPDGIAEGETSTTASLPSGYDSACYNSSAEKVYVYFTTVGTESWTIPDGVSSVDLTVVGGGGGGSISGGAGGYMNNQTGVSVSGIKSITVGAGGTAGSGVSGGPGWTIII